MNGSIEEALIQAISEQTKAQQAQTKAIMALVESNQALIVLLADSLSDEDDLDAESAPTAFYLNGKPTEQANNARQSTSNTRQKLLGDR